MRIGGARLKTRGVPVTVQRARPGGRGQAPALRTCVGALGEGLVPSRTGGRGQARPLRDAVLLVVLASITSVACVIESTPESFTTVTPRPRATAQPAATVAVAPTIVPANATAVPTRAGGQRAYTVDPRVAATQQADVDAARQPWRMDAVLVAGMTLEGEGVDTTRAQFSQSTLQPDPATNQQRVLVRATTPTGNYEVELMQPMRQGAGGIWMATASRRTA